MKLPGKRRENSLAFGRLFMIGLLRLLRHSCTEGKLERRRESIGWKVQTSYQLGIGGRGCGIGQQCMIDSV